MACGWCAHTAAARAPQMMRVEAAAYNDAHPYSEDAPQEDPPMFVNKVAEAAKEHVGVGEGVKGERVLVCACVCVSPVGARACVVGLRASGHAA